MKKQAFIILLSLLFQRIAVSQAYDSITLNAGKNIAIKRCYLCCGIRAKHDSDENAVFKQLYDNDSNYCFTFITGYLVNDTIQKIVELIKLHVKYFTYDPYDNSEERITYTFDHGKLFGAFNDNPGASYSYFFKNDSLIDKRLLVDDLGYFALGPDEALTYSKEDENMLRNSRAFIKSKH